MLYLVMSIIASVSVSVLLKSARQRGWRVEQMVAFNYIVTTLMTLLLLRPDTAALTGALPHLWLFVLLGVLLPSVFVIMGKAVAHAGIVKSDAAQRLSLFLPIVAAFVLFGEVFKPNTLAGVVLAFAALLCLLYKKQEGASTAPAADASPRQTALLLFGVWAGYGVIDILFKQLSKLKTALPASLLLAFVLAGMLMFAYLFFRKTAWHKASMLAGLLLGVLNFANILFYIKAHQAFKDNPTLVFAGMNMGVIVLGTLAGALLYREHISKTNAVGIVLALLAMVCLYFWTALFGG